MTFGEFDDLCKKNRVSVLVPTFNNEQTLANVLTSIFEYTSNVIVVNDGSTDSTAELLTRFPQVDLVSYAPNKGKGFALRTGFKHARQSGYDYVITIDSDGQHFAEDLPKFLEALPQHPKAIIMGVRNMEQAGIPGKSSFGHKFSNFWFWVETGLKINDTQSGYRLYPVRLLERTKWITRKFEFEIEVMVRSVWKGVEMAEVPVRVYYAPKGVRVSHFRPFKDFTRISILNTFLVIIALLYIHPRDFFFGKRNGSFWSRLKNLLFQPDESDVVKAVSVGVGIFIGILPIWGFQLLSSIGVAIAFRLNKALVIIASNISIFPPLILYLSHRTGSIWMGDKAQTISFDNNLTLDFVWNNTVQYIIGAITLAVVAAAFFTALTYLGLKIFRKR